MQSYASPGRVITIVNAGPGAVEVRRDQPYRLGSLIGITQHGAAVDADLNLCVEGMYDQMVDLAPGVAAVEAGSPVHMATDGTWTLVAGLTDTAAHVSFGIVTERMTRRRVVQVKLMPVASASAGGGGGTDPALITRVGAAEDAILVLDERADGADAKIAALQAGGGGGGSSQSKMLAIGGWTCGPSYTDGQARFVTSYGVTGQPIRGDKLVSNNADEFVWPASRDGVEPASKSYIKAVKGGVYEIFISARMPQEIDFPPNVGLEFRYSIWNAAGASQADNIPISIGVGPYADGYGTMGPSNGFRELSIMRLLAMPGGYVSARGLIYLSPGFTIALSGATYKGPAYNGDSAVLLQTFGYDGENAWQNSYRSSIMIRRV
ncbi:DUF2190 family protein [Sphingomonas sanguinis]|uniref:DUF2190 family protein n=1 Tax=Sphingomonas sp. LC-1 TaxID=3110957 RepID=UPI0021BA69D5|nr:DUF2190 family protein [Sphingomonas sp. LC-1]MCT8000570.1 DUF2190 family protein [Sphingomonas sp. LC-1]